MIPTAVLVFAKAPRPGAVKTRLIPVLGADGAAQLAAALIARTLATAAASRLGPVELWCAPDADDAQLQALAAAQGVSRRGQRGRDLGERMAHALADALTRHPQAVLIGCDCPPLTVADLHTAARHLEDGAEATLLPAEDGGYVLIGGRRAAHPVARLFAGVPWGTATVLAATRANAARAGLRLAEGRVLWDIDRPADLPRLATVPGGPAPVSAAAARR